ncbi:MAG: hypothetical protein JWN62_85 [Acidimicrobiales bacterium]|nr:hypothetical protein [Acidimicrobiales bacterium]
MQLRAVEGWVEDLANGESEVDLVSEAITSGPPRSEVFDGEERELPCSAPCRAPRRRNGVAVGGICGVAWCCCCAPSAIIGVVPG